ncbi:uracil-DNA glycosylase [Pusillimonas sp. ANT_WB101]|uniref:uracil-DNA glycosylase n=1 Tax=Pusillimonas sp. ANT_WB101 TaxID=2597356 RepID=UPI0011EE7503|nr:uracil-DNA glycosylase [Pusillimonas sp. ANT_WB101]KAA0888625.1 uracil-DNA glycosylase [Pusillimonas sp. ANT_WB101]
MNAPRLDALQLAWLQELGIDRQMLAHYVADAEPFGQAAAGPQAPQGGEADVSSVSARVAGHEAGLARAMHDVSSDDRGLAQSRAASNPADATDSIAGRHAADAMAARDEAFAVMKSGAGLAKAPAVVAQASPHTPPRTPQEIPDTWDALQASIAVCKACDLHHGRSQAVFGAGMAQSPDWLVVGEAPGDYDDREGVPFQGKAGVLLQAMLASIGIPPDSPIFFTNLVKCRPLGNRPPAPEEIEACMPYLQRQITLLKPGRILVLGRVAAQSVLGSEAELDALRGQVHRFISETGQEIPVVVTHHPASLLMRPQHKADVWQDLNLAKALA